MYTNFEVNRYKIDKFIKHAKRSLYDLQFKSYGPKSVFFMFVHVFGNLDL